MDVNLFFSQQLAMGSKFPVCEELRKFPIKVSLHQYDDAHTCSEVLYLMVEGDRLGDFCTFIGERKVCSVRGVQILANNVWILKTTDWYSFMTFVMFGLKKIFQRNDCWKSYTA
jgi:hypothetical protein